MQISVEKIIIRLFLALPISCVGNCRASNLKFIGTNMPSVKIRDTEPFDVALRRFKRACEKAGVLTETRKREFYEKPTWARKRMKAAAVKRLAKRLSRENRRTTRMY